MRLALLVSALVGVCQAAAATEPAVRVKLAIGSGTYHFASPAP